VSFILDALKKSEAARQREVIPGLIEPVLGRPSARPTLLAVALLALLGINLIVVAVILLRRPGRSAATPAVIAAKIAAANAPDSAGRVVGSAPANAAGSAAGTAAGSAAGTAQAASRVAPNGEVPLFAPEVPVTSADNPIVEAARARLAADRSARSAPPAPTAGSAASPADEQSLPTLAQMDFSGKDALPPLHLDVHVYAANPAQRFVFINGRKYTEGSTMPQGPTVVRIRPDGVELEYRGQRFLLPRG